MRLWTMGFSLATVLAFASAWGATPPIAGPGGAVTPLLAKTPDVSPARRAAVWTTSSSRIPRGASEALLEIKRSSQKIQTFALTPANEWVVVAGNRPRYSPGFPRAIREQIDRYVSEGKEIDVIAFSPSNQWVLIAEDWLRESTNPAIPGASKLRPFPERSPSI